MQPIQPTPQAVIFDLDGTLADTFPLIVSSWNEAMREPLGQIFTAEEVVSRFGIPDEQMIKRDLPAAAWEKAIATYFKYYEVEHEVVQPFPGIADMLEKLRQARMPLGLVTGKGSRATEITLRRLGWANLFGSVITGDDVTHQKPHPEGVLHVAATLDAKPERSLYVGDSPVDINAGRNAGMVTVAAAWHAVYLDRLRPLKPDYWAESPGDILAICGV